MKVSVTIETMLGVNWAMWKQMLPQLEDMGFATVFRSDHFSLGSPPVSDALELITSLTYLADHTRRVDFGPLVAPVSVRDPVMLARQAMSLDMLSGGRMILGVGAGWKEDEHTQFGYHLGDLKTRSDRLEEALVVITSLVRRAEPVDFQGRFYQLNGALLLPRPAQPTRILVGGNGLKRTLPLAARFADIWNCLAETPERFQELSAQLDDLIRAAGRAPEDVRRSLMLPVVFYRTPEELHGICSQARKLPVNAGRSDEDILGMFASMKCIQGGPEEVIRKMQVYADAGVDEFVVQVFGVNDLDNLRALASEIMPNFAAVH